MDVPMIGYVHLALKLIVEGMYDFVCGEAEEIEHASIFFYGDHDIYHLALDILGIPRDWKPILVEHVHGGKPITKSMRNELEKMTILLDEISSNDITSLADAMRVDYVTKTTKHM